jgi:hypothetical protein
MAEIHQCEQCGAVLAAEDVFCGECGAPRPGSIPAAAPAGAPAPEAMNASTARPALPRAVGPAAASRPAAPPSKAPVEGMRAASRVIAILSAAVAAGLCGLGVILAFFASDPQTGQTGSGDMVFGSVLLCFGPGAMALVLAVVLWLVAKRRKAS